MSGKQATKSDDACIMKSYFPRYHLRTLKHFPQLYSDEFLQAVPIVPMNQDEDEYYPDLNGSLKSTRSNQYRQLERHIDCSSYKKSMKLLKASKKSRRKQYDLENDDKHNEIVYLNRLAENLFAKDSMAQRLVGVSEINKKISNLFDRIHQKILKAKRELNHQIKQNVNVIPMNFFFPFFFKFCFAQKHKHHHSWELNPLLSICRTLIAFCATEHYGNQ